jgi:hypothetical protein
MQLRFNGTLNTSKPRFALVVAIYTVLIAVQSWSVVTNLGTHIPGSEGDAWVNLWTLEWVKDAVLSGESPFFTSRMFYPQGTYLFTHNISWVHTALWIPLQAALGIGAAYSLLILASMVFNATTMFFFAHAETESYIGAFAAGLIAAFWPHIISNHNHPNHILIGWIPLALLFLKRSIEQKASLSHDDGAKANYSAPIMAGICVALVGLSFWHYLIMGSVLLISYSLLLIARKQHAPYATLLKRAVAAGGVALVLVLPILVPIVAFQMTRSNPDDLVAGSIAGGQADLLAYVTPSRLHPIWGSFVFQEFYASFGINQIYVPFIGYGTLLASAYGLRRYWPRSRFWLIPTVVLVLFALGPSLTFNGREITPLPYPAFVLDLIRDVDRFNSLLVVPFGILSAWGIKALWEHPGIKKPTRITIAVVLLLIIAFEFQATFPLYSLEVPEWHKRLALETGDFALLELPQNNQVYDETYMFYQLTHGKSLVNGHVSRPPREAFAFIRSMPMLDGFPWRLEPPSNVVEVSGQLQTLSDAGIRYLTFHKQFLSPEQLDSWKTWIGLTPNYEDEAVVVYETSVDVARDPNYEPIGETGLGVLGVDVSPRSITQAGWLHVQMIWASDENIERSFDCCIAIEDSEGPVQETSCQSISPDRPTMQWERNEVVRATYPVQVNPFLKSENYILTAHLVDTDTKAALAPRIPIGTVASTSLPRTFTLPVDPELIASDAQWGAMIKLLGWRAREAEDDTVILVLRWQALTRIPASYKLFVHLVNTGSGELIAQEDTIPRNWQYPTHWWERGELVEDVVSISVDDGALPEQYVLQMGWYDEKSGERLPVTTRLHAANHGAIDLVSRTESGD